VPVNQNKSFFTSGGKKFFRTRQAFVPTHFTSLRARQKKISLAPTAVGSWLSARAHLSIFSTSQSAARFFSKLTSRGGGGRVGTDPQPVVTLNNSGDCQVGLRHDPAVAGEGNILTQSGVDRGQKKTGPNNQGMTERPGEFRIGTSVGIRRTPQRACTERTTENLKFIKEQAGRFRVLLTPPM